MDARWRRTSTAAALVGTAALAAAALGVPRRSAMPPRVAEPLRPGLHCCDHQRDLIEFSERVEHLGIVLQPFEFCRRARRQSCATVRIRTEVESAKRPARPARHPLGWEPAGATELLRRQEWLEAEDAVPRIEVCQTALAEVTRRARNSRSTSGAGADEDEASRRVESRRLLGGGGGGGAPRVIGGHGVHPAMRRIGGNSITPGRRIAISRAPVADRDRCVPSSALAERCQAEWR